MLLRMIVIQRMLLQHSVKSELIGLPASPTCRLACLVARLRDL